MIAQRKQVAEMISNLPAVDNPVRQKKFIKTVYKTKIVWINVILYIYLHLSFLYAVYLGFTTSYFKTVIFAYIYGNLGSLGITAGSHRLWSHRSYKAKWPLRVLLCCLVSIASQNDIYEWSRDHRVHHKFTDTDADPHNIRRGFFFAHIGWLMCKKHPDVVRKGKTVVFEDLWADPIVRFHKRFYLPMSIFFCFIIPTIIPSSCWDETTWNSFFIAGLGKYCLSLNLVWLVNSAAHTYGYRPYDKCTEARENPLLSIHVLGESFHNFHHAFPWDYSTSEFGYKFNVTKLFIDFMALIGQAYDLKCVDHELVKKRKLKILHNVKIKQMDK